MAERRADARINRKGDMVNKFNTELAEKVRAEMYREASERMVELEQERLNAIFSTLGGTDTDTPYSLRSFLNFSQGKFSTLNEIRNGVEAGDRKAMLELLTILSDTLRVFGSLPQDVRDTLADSIEKMRMKDADAIKKRSDNFQTVREQGVHSKKEAGQKLRNVIEQMNTELLEHPASEGWTVEARANHIAGKVNRKESYVRRLIATPRKINQT